MDRDSITRTGARAPGVERWNRSHGGACKRIIPDTEQGVTMQQRARRTMANQPAGKASSDSPALEPYRGKPAVRNFRGGDGNVGIIRSPVRAIALPDINDILAMSPGIRPGQPTVTKTGAALRGSNT